MGSDELGAHVSTAGGVARAPARAAEIDSVVLQLFTKQPSRWAEVTVDAPLAEEFARECAMHRVHTVIAHDAYLINLATHDDVLFERSLNAFRGELQRCAQLGIAYVVTHPGNATDGNLPRGLERNAAAIAQVLDEVSGPSVLLETTPGSGTSVGARFEALARIRELVGAPNAARVGVCIDTCHVWAAGYDLRSDYAGVIAQVEDVIGIENVKLFHLNDSVGGLGSRRDRHAHIGEGALGDAPFRALLNDARFASVPKVLETPKGEDPGRYAEVDLMNLGRLRGMRG